MLVPELNAGIEAGATEVAVEAVADRMGGSKGAGAILSGADGPGGAGGTLISGKIVLRLKLT